MIEYTKKQTEITIFYTDDEKSNILNKNLFRVHL